MSARKLGDSEFLNPVSISSQAIRLNLPAHAVRIRKNGIEFRAQDPIRPWTEIVINLQTIASSRKLHCHGVVIGCDGNRHAGYLVSVVFTGLSRHAQAQVESLVSSGLA
jgi:hypothetical protein